MGRFPIRSPLILSVAVIFLIFAIVRRVITACPPAASRRPHLRLSPNQRVSRQYRAACRALRHPSGIRQPSATPERARLSQCRFALDWRKNEPALPTHRRTTLPLLCSNVWAARLATVQQNIGVRDQLSTFHDAVT